MTAYYNEWDKGAAAWLRCLIDLKLIPHGVVDTRSITEVMPDDLKGFNQCHFFAGIGGWPLALRIAGIPDSASVWTGSPPCQPFSLAGRNLGFTDPRHLAPALLDLVAERRPAVLFGEQVKAAIGKHWLDFVFLDLEAEGYACASAVLPACSVGAPHQRDRLFFGAQLAYHNDHRQQSGQGDRQGHAGQPAGYDFGRRSTADKLDDLFSVGWVEGRERNNGRHVGQQPAAAGEAVNLVNLYDTRPQDRIDGYGQLSFQERREDAERHCGHASVLSRLSDAIDSAEQREIARSVIRELQAGNGGMFAADRQRGAHNSFWAGADWLGCRDGHFRPVESGTFPLAHGVPARVGRLRGYGNAIVPQLAAVFIKAWYASIDDHAVFG